MKLFSRSALLIATISLMPAAAVLAQTNNPGKSGGSGSVANQTYETGTPNPALETGRLPKGATSVPADENPTVRGATGDTIVKGDRSTITGDRRATVQQKTGEGVEGGSN